MALLYFAAGGTFLMSIKTEAAIRPAMFARRCTCPRWRLLAPRQFAIPEFVSWY